MPGGMDHDRNKLGPSLDVRIRGSNQEPTLNGSVVLPRRHHVLRQFCSFPGQRSEGEAASTSFLPLLPWQCGHTQSSACLSHLDASQCVRPGNKRPTFSVCRLQFPTQGGCFGGKGADELLCNPSVQSVGCLFRVSTGGYCCCLTDGRQVASERDKLLSALSCAALTLATRAQTAA